MTTPDSNSQNYTKPPWRQQRQHAAVACLRDKHVHDIKQCHLSGIYCIENTKKQISMKTVIIMNVFVCLFIYLFFMNQGYPLALSCN